MEVAFIIDTSVTAVATVALVVATFQLARKSGTMAKANQEVARDNRRMVEVNREMLQEMRESRVVQEGPQVIVDTDHSKPPLVYVVVRKYLLSGALCLSLRLSYANKDYMMELLLLVGTSLYLVSNMKLNG